MHTFGRSGGGTNATHLLPPCASAVAAVKSLQHEVQPSPGSHWDRIWHKELAPPDPEPLYAPKSLDSMCYTSKRPVYQHVQPVRARPQGDMGSLDAAQVPVDSVLPPTLLDFSLFYASYGWLAILAKGG